jgi:hypothetical protein
MSAAVAVAVQIAASVAVACLHGSLTSEHANRKEHRHAIASNRARANLPRDGAVISFSRMCRHAPRRDQRLHGNLRAIGLVMRAPCQSALHRARRRAISGSTTGMGHAARAGKGCVILRCACSKFRRYRASASSGSADCIVPAARSATRACMKTTASGAWLPFACGGLVLDLHVDQAWPGAACIDVPAAYLHAGVAQMFEFVLDDVVVEAGAVDQ